MDKRTNRRELIIDMASQLFVKNGYSATSIRQIAKQVGCTEAAIYYHFKGGKRELFQAVAEYNIVELMNVLTKHYEVESLHDLVIQLAQELIKDDQGFAERSRWITAEFPQLNAEERELFYQNHTRLHEQLAALVEQFVDDKARASHIAYTLICTYWGYIQLFRNLGLESVVDFRLDDLTRTLIEGVVTG